MAAQLHVLRRRIKSVTSTKKITNAQELVATSRIGKAQARIAAFRPYAEEITEVLNVLASDARIDHPLLTPRPNARRAGVLVVTSDRGLCGAYNANAIRTAEQLVTSLHEQGKEIALFVIGRKGVTHYRFRNRPIEESWTGFSEQPGFLRDVRRVGHRLVEAFLLGSAGESEAGQRGDGERVTGIDELYMVSTRFVSLMTQTPVANQLAPLQVEQATGLLPAYEFEPDSETLLNALLPKYINNRIFAALLESAASESAARRRACKAATDNAEEMIQKYTREMNTARQAAITQEISEIVGGADALAAARSEVC
jgi:F-type H+-transporting ATPase subunit gamma